MQLTHAYEPQAGPRWSTTRASGSLGTVTLERSETFRPVRMLHVPSPATNSAAAAFERARASRWESAWDVFVKDVTSRPCSAADVEWLLGRTAAPATLSYQAGEALARIWGVVGERQENARLFAIMGLALLLVHSAPGVRIAALEGAVQVHLPIAKVFAMRGQSDESRSVREVAETIAAMTA